MGGDGGQVIDRATMVKTKGWGLTKNGGNRYAASLGEMANYVQYLGEDRGQGYLERRRTQMQNCYISQQRLLEPLVACRLGNLYNKEAVIGALLNKTMPSGASHIRALKDVKNCVVTFTDVDGEPGERRMVCPVAREELDQGSARAVLIWTTGAIISAKTFKELKLKDCPVTGQAFDPELDVVPLAPDEEELNKLKLKLPTKKRKAVAAPADEAPKEIVKAGYAGTNRDTTAKAKTPGAYTKTKAGKEMTPVFKKLLTGSTEGFNGARDGFGCPSYNRGSRI